MITTAAPGSIAPNKTETEATHPDHFGHSVCVLNRAANQGYVEMFDHLVSRGANPASLCSAAPRVLRRVRQPARCHGLSHLVQQHEFDANGTSEPDGVHNSCWNPGPYEGSPLNWAVYRGALRGGGEDAVVEALNMNSAEPDEDAIGLAAKYGTLSALELLLGPGGSATEGLIFAVKQNRLDAAQVCLHHGADGHVVGTVNEMSQDVKGLLAELK